MHGLGAAQRTYRPAGDPLSDIGARAERAVAKVREVLAQRRTAMNVPTKPNNLQTYQVLFFDRSLHPEVIPVRTKRVVKHGAYEFEAWLGSGSHALVYEHKGLSASELVTDQERHSPSSGLLSAFLAAGEHEFEHTFPKQGVTYMLSVQTETLAENVYASVYEELMEHGRETSSLMHQWSDETGPCLSMIDIQRATREVHAQVYHLFASLGLVVRTQSIFEHA